MADEEEGVDTESFGPHDNSEIARILRGEIELEYSAEMNDKEMPTFWETAAIRRKDERIVVCINGTSKREYSADNPNYQNILERLRQKFPDLAPGKVCTIYRFKGGRIETKTKEF
ncbi:MAG: hypothetical protein K8F91_20035 [Candidatus Obscuribacterales bacterium]|nr:hypothetical protein [Candidatus Obscuribacterales bacterium]